jgi:tRNA dimethylallyltransferase
MDKVKLVIITGPTAAGKSSLAVKLCKDFNGCVINADSVQLYKHLDIGTAKPSKEEMSGVPHYLMDILDPKEDFSAAEFRAAAVKKIKEIRACNQNVFVVGGTGLYVRVLTGGVIDVPASDPEIRAELKARAEKYGAGSLYDELKTVDEASALTISENDLFRIIRALEVYKSTGMAVSQIRAEHSFKDSEFLPLKIGLKMERDKLYKRIEARVDNMISAGLEDEVKRLVEMGYKKELKSLSSIGYKQMIMYLDGDISHDEAVRLIKRDTKRYAKRQFTWFKKDKDILWYDAEEAAQSGGYKLIKKAVSDFLDYTYNV